MSDDSDEEVSELEVDPVREPELHPPAQISTIATTVRKFRKVPHHWLCEGRLLHLLDPLSKENTK